MPNQIKIIVCGPAASGTTTIAAAITKALGALGFSVENTDPDIAIERRVHPSEIALTSMVDRGTGVCVNVQRTRLWPSGEMRGDATFKLPADTTEEEAIRIVRSYYRRHEETVPA